MFKFSKFKNFIKKPTTWALISVLFFAGIGFNYFSLATNCNGKNLDPGFGEGVIESQVFKEAGIEAKYYAYGNNNILEEDNIFGFGLNDKPDIIDSLLGFFPNGNCVIKSSSSKSVIINHLEISPLNYSRALIHYPKQINLLNQKRVYSLKENLKYELENALKDYKLYKYDKIWVIQNDSYSYQNDSRVGAGKLVSFDEGKNWLPFKQEDFPKHLAPQKEEKVIKNQNFRHGDNFSYLYEIVKEDMVESGDDLKAKYFILDAGLTSENSQTKKINYCDDGNVKKLDNSVFWIEVESQGGKNRRKFYYQTNIQQSYKEKDSKIPCSSEVRFNDDFSDKNTKLLKEKLGL
jgi:hypothetical protein